MCVYVQRASMSEYGEDEQGFDDQASYEDGRRSYSRSPPPPPSFRGRPSVSGQTEQGFDQSSNEGGRRSPSRSPPRRQSSPPSPPSLHARPSAGDQTLVLAYKPLREKPVPTCDASDATLPPQLGYTVRELSKKMKANPPSAGSGWRFNGIDSHGIDAGERSECV